MSRKALILGGCGFIGSHVVNRFLAAGDEVVVVDGLLDRTGARREHLPTADKGLTLITEPIEHCSSLSEHVGDCQVVIDSMAWTAHKLAQDDPQHDLRLNVTSHLSLLQCLRTHPTDVIYLGTRSQYGRSDRPVIDEAVPMEPVDVQGIHKLAAESYFRIFSRRDGYNAVSLRIGNTFGPRQPVVGTDIGLIGGIIRDSLQDEPVSIFGQQRAKQFIYVADLADIVYRISTTPPEGFSAFNVAGPLLNLCALAQSVIELTGRGSLHVAEMPVHIAQIDSGDAVLSIDKLNGQIGALPEHDLTSALRQTIDHFEQQLEAHNWH